MLLTELRAFLQLRKSASLLELARQLNTAPELVREMLSLWIRKGRVRLCHQIPGCGSKCMKCDPAQTEIYEWVE